MRTIEGFIVAPIMQDQKLRTLAAREFQTTLVGMMGHDLRQSLHVIRSPIGRGGRVAFLDLRTRSSAELRRRHN